MTDEIASFKVTAADIQKQEFHPSGDVHMQCGGHFTHTHTHTFLTCVPYTHMESIVLDVCVSVIHFITSDIEIFLAEMLNSLF